MTDLTVETVSLLAYVPPLHLKPCCARPGNAVRKATLEDITAWAADHDYHLVHNNEFNER